MEIPGDLNFTELSKASGVTKRHVYCMIVFIDWLNQQGKHMNIKDINSLKIKKNKNKWQFLIKSKKYPDILKFDHEYEFIED